MRARLRKLGLTLAALAALAFGGSALAPASQRATPVTPLPVAIQSQPADQIDATDPSGAADNRAEAGSSKADTDNVQRDQTANDQRPGDPADSHTDRADSASDPSDGSGSSADTEQLGAR